MSRDYDIISRNISNAELAITHSKEMLEQKSASITASEIDNLKVEAKELEKLAKKFCNFLNSLSSL
ncbi:MAG: hypothetical protein IJ809_04240 [Clostridia bacterium]|nr:hypothetical protein [Clostridia bacterium]